MVLSIINHEPDNIFRTNSTRTAKLKHNARFLTITGKSSFAHANTNRLSTHNILSNQLHNFMYRYNEFGVLPVLKKLWFKAPTQRPKHFSVALPEQEMSLTPTPSVTNTNHEPTRWASISLRCQQMSLHIQHL